MKLLELHTAIRAAGYDISGLSGTGPDDVRITGWNIEPTKEQEAGADSIVKGFDWSETQAKTEEQLKVEIASLTQDQRMKLVDRLIIELGLANPEKFESAKEITLGIKE